MADPQMTANGAKLLCWFKKRFVSVAAIAAAFLTISTAMGLADHYRWWVWKSEFMAVAKRVYEISIPEQIRVISSIRRDLDSAKSIPLAKRDYGDNLRIDKLEQELAREQDKLQQLIDERAKYGRAK